MYSRCLFCHAALGRNDALEAFPVGRRLAYDADRGRLWAVCTQCSRWNLTPLEERWEAIEAAEQLYRGTRLRASTDNIGLARVADGVDLVRVGRAHLPEFAAWRYGAALIARRRRHVARSTATMAVGGVGALATLAGYAYLPHLAGSLTAVGGLLAMAAVEGVGRLADHVQTATRDVLTGSAVTVAGWVPVHLRDGSRTLLVVRRGHLAESTLDVDGDGALTLDVRHDGGRADVRGTDARRAALLLSPALNPEGATRTLVDDAVRAINVRGGPERSLALAGRWIGKQTGRPSTGRPSKSPDELLTLSRESRVPEEGLYALTTTQRLALEIALHEDVERRALDGELAELERAWRDAEEIAAIADGLVLPAGVEEAWRRLRDRVSA